MDTTTLAPCSAGPGPAVAALTRSLAPERLASACWPTLHWQVGWGLVLLGFLGGALLGLGFHREGFAGGYAALRRRLLRLAHVALVALGFLNLVVSTAPAGWLHPTASLLLLTGSALMPATCLLAAWRAPLRHAFGLPVLALVGAGAGFLVHSLQGALR